MRIEEIHMQHVERMREVLDLLQNGLEGALSEPEEESRKYGPQIGGCMLELYNAAKAMMLAENMEKFL